ncbi:hypothetical protein ES703_80401 [subsurface metagenome]
MFAVKPMLWGIGNEELAAISIGARVGHGQSTSHVGVLSEFINKSVAGTACSRSGRVSSLSHSPRYYPMEGSAIVESFTGKEDKVIDGDGNVTGK